MMMSSQVLINTFLYLLAAVSACPGPSEYEHQHNLTKRWHSVGNPDFSRGEYPWINAWYEDGEETDDNGNTITIRPIRMCFATQADYDSLHTVVEGGADMWKDAISQSTLRFRYDKGTQADPWTVSLCPDSRPDAVEITDVTDSSDVAGIIWGSASLGYKSAAFMANQGNTRPHSLQFGRRGGSLPGAAPQASDTLHMAHELGHVIGLTHEFQRPDARQYVSFICNRLSDYNEVSVRVQQAGEGHTMARVCRDMMLSIKYRFSAWNYLPMDFGPTIGQHAWSEEFDYNSIMMYDTTDGSYSNRVPFSYVLLRIDQGNHFVNPDLMMGGPGRKISAGDVARVKQLYPLPNFDLALQISQEPEWEPTSRGLPIIKRATETGIPLA